MNEKVKVLYGTEKSYYEPKEIEFDKYKDAKNKVKEIEDESRKCGYKCFASIVKDEREENDVREILKGLYRDYWAMKNYGCSYDKLEERMESYFRRRDNIAMKMFGRRYDRLFKSDRDAVDKKLNS